MRAPPAPLVALLIAGCAGPQSLQVIDNILSHEGPPPPAPGLVREFLAQPLAAPDAAAIFERSVPAALHRLAEPVPESPGPQVELGEFLEPFLLELAAAQQALQAAVPAVGELPAALPTPALQRELGAKVDPLALRRVAELFLEANARFVRAVRAARGRILFPERGARIAFAEGTVLIGTSGDDVHERRPLRNGEVFVLIDPGGDDMYRGSDVVLHGLSAILDLGGNDRYESDGPAWAAAVGGVSLLLDVAGDDAYAAGDFAQGAALAGVGALIDLEGDDRYRLRAFGQGLGLAGGTGILWDRAGHDRYAATGLPDAYERGGALSFAQGAAVGVRTGMGGGVGILRDDAGDDDYEAQLFAQGVGYYYALGLLWDVEGHDQYRAARYAQGSGVHEAVGVLRDETGNDNYDLSVGVGQGMGLDLAVGVLADLAGDDRYAAPALAQGAATSNGVGILIDRVGRNEWHLAQASGWGRAEWSRGLPSLGLRYADVPRTEAMVVHEAETETACPPPGPAAPDVLAAIARLRADDFDALWPLGFALRCELSAADDKHAQSMWDAFERLTSTPHAGIIAGALHARLAPPEQMRRLVAQLSAHPSCGVRTAALALDGTIAAAQAALRSGCWRLQARALRILREQGIAPEDTRAVPDFLLQAYQASGKRSASSRSP